MAYRPRSAKQWPTPRSSSRCGAALIGMDVRFGWQRSDQYRKVPFSTAP